MTKYLTINCDLAGKVLGYGAWLGFSIIILFGVFIQYSTLQSYTENGNCMIEFFSKNTVCIFGSDNYSWDWNSKGLTEGFLKIQIIIFIILQVFSLIFLNMMKEWVGVKCKN